MSQHNVSEHLENEWSFNLCKQFVRLPNRMRKCDLWRAASKMSTVFEEEEKKAHAKFERQIYGSDTAIFVMTNEKHLKKTI